MLSAIVTTCAVLGILARRLGWMLPEPIELNLRALRIRPLGPRKASIERLRRRLARRRAKAASQVRGPGGRRCSPGGRRTPVRRAIRCRTSGLPDPGADA
jgi:hypothetical protein